MSDVIGQPQVLRWMIDKKLKNEHCKILLNFIFMRLSVSICEQYLKLWIFLLNGSTGHDEGGTWEQVHESWNKNITLQFHESVKFFPESPRKYAGLRKCGNKITRVTWVKIELQAVYVC